MLKAMNIVIAPVLSVQHRFPYAEKPIDSAQVSY